MKIRSIKNERNSAWLISLACVLLIVAVVVLIFTGGNRSTDELKITATQNVSGVKCINDSETNFILRELPADSYKNTIVASFIENNLTSISYTFVGKYASSTEAGRARGLAEKNYNLTLSEKLGLDITVFARNMALSGDMVYITITATNNEYLTSKTAPIFMLSDNQKFPIDLDGLRLAYEEVGFKCEVNN